MDPLQKRPYGDETIAAIATPEGVGGIAIVRVSGSGAADIARTVFPAAGRPLESHRIRHGMARAADGTPLDEVLVLPMFAPRSYTGEDVIEFHCHGGRMPARRVLEACLAAGARPAAAGEFTRRAFLNGRLSLDQAEAVADLIHSESEMAARAALQQMTGGMRREIERLEAPLRDLLARLEGGLEFSDEEMDDLSARETAAVLEGVLSDLDRLLALADAGKRLRDGISVVLVGAPNSGKSSLFNALLGEARAIVDHQAGTTRDFVSQAMTIGGHRFVLNDTAGLRADPGRVEAIGIERTRALIADADIVLDLRAADTGRPADGIPPETSAAVISVATKADLIPDAARKRDGGLETSAVTGEGLGALKRRLLEVADRDRLDEAVSLGVVLNRRHLHRLDRAKAELVDLLAITGHEDAGDEVIATMLSALLAELGEISGRAFSETLLGDVFSRFCVGK